ncbi:MAG: hypothetical protein JW871_00345 [Endomicrobiales bacterium]|nr:hypothetical protein [Endomicrobiales bacterium]
MSDQQKVELTLKQIDILLQIINKTNFVGNQAEIVTNLKQTLIMMLKQKQGAQPAKT